jgi:hypothetical protein
MRHVWTGNDLTVRIYFDDGNGNRINALGNPFVDGVDLPLLEYCFFQTAKVSGTLTHARIPETGRLTRRIVTEDFQYSMDVSHFYFMKSTELSTDNIFNREKCIQLDMFFFDLASGNDQDHHWLKAAYAVDFSIDAQDNQIASGTVKFSGEYFE